MKNFLVLQDEMEKIVQRTDSNAKNLTSQLLRSEVNSFRLNRISAYEEPPDPDTETELNDTEFDRRISIDQCVQFVPSVIFEQTVEDHWFASIASIVHLEDPDKARIARSVQEFTEKLMVYSNARLPPVVSSWKLCEKIFTSHQTDSRSGFYSILNFVFQEQLKQLYREEQTQAVAILATIGSQLGLTISDPHFSLSVQLGIHDHANLFQRLKNWKNARIMEKNRPFQWFLRMCFSKHLGPLHVRYAILKFEAWSSCVSPAGTEVTYVTWKNISNSPKNVRILIVNVFVETIDRNFSGDVWYLLVPQL